MILNDNADVEGVTGHAVMIDDVVGFGESAVQVCIALLESTNR